MKTTLLALALGLPLSASAQAQLYGTPNDPWDMSQGAVITGSSGDQYGTLPNVFGNSVVSPEPEVAFFRSDKDAGFVHYVEWRTQDLVTLDGYSLHAASDDRALPGDRGFSTFNLYCRPSPDDPFVLLDSFSPAGPVYHEILERSFPPVRSQWFRAEFIQLNGQDGIDPGPRVVELDAHVVVPRPPEITTQPAGVTNNLGGAVSLSVTAIQNVEGSMSYQWLKDGIFLPGATNPVLTITNVQPPSIGDYQVVVGNTLGSVTSSVAQLTIAGIKPEVWRGMVAYYPFDGSIRDESVYNGSGQMTKGEYSTNRLGKLTSSLLLRTNNDVVLNVNAGVLPVGSADRTFSMWIQPNPSKLYSQEYFLALIYGNDSVPGGALTMFIQNDVFNLNPFPLPGDPRLLAQRPSRIWHGEWRHLVWVMHGTERKAECYLDGVQVPDGSFGFPGQHVINTLHTQVRVGSWHPDAPSTQQFYGGLDDIRIYRRALSRDEVISLYHSELSPVPTFGRQPQSVTVNLGESTLLSATATNAMSYQWLKDGIPLPGATNSVLVITNVQPTSFGDYEVAVGNALGSVTSQVASVRLQTTEDVMRVTLLDFNTDPSSVGLYREFGNGAADWRSTGGASGAVNDGYLSGNDAKGSQQWCLVFKDLDAGLVVKAFKFECDLRIGGGTSRPADGFSINYVRSGDDLLTNADNGIDPTFLNFAGAGGEEHLPEEGSLSGLGIGFDTWQSGNHTGGITDVVGISIRVDGELIAQMPVPLQLGNVWPGGVFDDVPYRNLSTSSPDYPKSMQTGALTTDEDLNGDGVVDGNDIGLVPQPNYSDDPIRWAKWIKNLKWERFVAEFTEDARVRIRWKGFEVTPEGGLPVNYTPSPSRFVFAGRTGGAWEVHHVDNIAFTTVGSAVPGFLATLSGLSIIGGGGDLSPAFDGATTNYAVVVRDVVDNVAVTPTASHGGATIELRVNGGAFATVASGSASMPLALQFGVNTIDVRVTAGDGVTALTYAVAVTRLSRFLTWKLDHYDSTASAGNSANDSISAGDGLTNLEKYAFGLDPKQPTPGGLVVSGNLITSRGKPVFSVVTTPTSVGMKARFVRRKIYLADGLKFTVQFSPDLASWQTSTAIPTVVASDADFEVVEVPYPLFVNGRKAGFFRVNVGLQP